MTCGNVIEFSELSRILDAKTERMVGKILTIIEAIVPGDRQADASKATVKSIIWDFNRDVKSSCGVQQNITEEN
jgi:hypothetical protein